MNLAILYFGYGQLRKSRSSLYLEAQAHTRKKSLGKEHPRLCPKPTEPRKPLLGLWATTKKPNHSTSKPLHIREKVLGASEHPELCHQASATWRSYTLIWGNYEKALSRSTFEAKTLSGKKHVGASEHPDYA
jgi:hypothetical protein